MVDEMHTVEVNGERQVVRSGSPECTAELEDGLERRGRAVQRGGGRGHVIYSDRETIGAAAGCLRFCARRGTAPWW